MFLILKNNLNRIASEARQSSELPKSWIAAPFGLAMTIFPMDCRALWARNDDISDGLPRFARIPDDTDYFPCLSHNHS